MNMSYDWHKKRSQSGYREREHMQTAQEAANAHQYISGKRIEIMILSNAF